MLQPTRRLLPAVARLLPVVVGVAMLGCEPEARQAPPVQPAAAAASAETVYDQTCLLFMEIPPMAPEARDAETDAKWREQLTPEQYRVLREKGTEQPFTGRFNKHDEAGTYVCAACRAELFPSDAKFDSGTGWPSFYDVANSENVDLQRDTSHGMTRVEVLCKHCGGHLGHLFEDGPQPTGLRYCINSASLDFKPASAE
ncbi:MAG: peptide-methionine (R)-S-oxide reductase MsrB [Phycisphaeraceae bacterium]